MLKLKWFIDCMKKGKLNKKTQFITIRVSNVVKPDGLRSNLRQNIRDNSCMFLINRLVRFN